MGWLIVIVIGVFILYLIGKGGGKDANFYNNRGVEYDKRDNLDRAIADHSEAIRLNPDFTAACETMVIRSYVIRT